jgi:hypothetical protein
MHKKMHVYKHYTIFIYLKISAGCTWVSKRLT